MDLLNCARCGHSWYQRKPGKPRSCAKCKALYWDRPARIPKHHGEPRPVGRPCKYPVYLLEVGQKMILPWPRDHLGRSDENMNMGMNRAICNYARKAGRTFFRHGVDQGLYVERLT